MLVYWQNGHFLLQSFKYCSHSPLLNTVVCIFAAENGSKKSLWVIK